MLSDLKITEFLSRTASKDPVPGGGSISALAAALSAALSEMVAGLTVGKKEFESYEKEMTDITKKARTLREKLTLDIDRDSDAYNRVIRAFGLPNDTEENKNRRRQAILEGLKQASLAPLSVAKDAVELLDIAGQVVEKGNKNAVTDAAVAVMMARTAILGAILNVKINLDSIKDKAFVEDLKNQIQGVRLKAEQREKDILNKIDLMQSL
ncbi:MAG: cyclodeaminase/cyclohydrolase family protein [Deltaproteobacteria bacterium]|nr:cyclodeaminase/cyclohydrolase family protein [Deltaproteobacteria bacterium]